jgi:hypothetical protein
MMIFLMNLTNVEANAAKALAEAEALAEEQAMQEWKGGGRAGSQIITRSPKSGNQQMANVGKVKFQPPNVPVIFVLGLIASSFDIHDLITKINFSGGPGSGKVTHCDTLMQEKRGVTHINMMDLLQQYAIGNGKLSARLLIVLLHEHSRQASENKTTKVY